MLFQSMLFAHHIFLCDLIDIGRRGEYLVVSSKLPALIKPEFSFMPTEGVKEDNNEEDEWEYQDESDIYLRSKFFESWLWKTVDLPAQADRDG